MYLNFDFEGNHISLPPILILVFSNVIELLLFSVAKIDLIYKKIQSDQTVRLTVLSVADILKCDLSAK